MIEKYNHWCYENNIRKRKEEEFFSDKLFKFPYLIEAPPCVQNSLLRGMQRHDKRRQATICPRSSDPFYVVTYYIKWVTTSGTHSIPPESVWESIYSFAFINTRFLLHVSNLAKAVALSNKVGQGFLLCEGGPSYYCTYSYLWIFYTLTLFIFYHNFFIWLFIIQTMQYAVNLLNSLRDNYKYSIWEYIFFCGKFRSTIVPFCMFGVQ